MTHSSCKLQITKSFHCCSGPLQKTLNSKTYATCKDKAPSLEMCIIFYFYSSLSFPKFCFNPYFNRKLGFIWLCCCVVVPNWNIAKLLLSPRTIFNWNFWSSALLSLSLCQPPPHILFGGHHQLLQFVVEVVTRLFEPRRGGDFCVHARLCCFRHVECWATALWHEIWYLSALGGWLGRFPDPGHPCSTHGNLSQQPRHSPVSTLYCLPCALQGAGASLGHLSLV